MAEWRMAKPIDFEMAHGEHIAIVGPNASGKSMLVDIITGAHPLMGTSVEYDFSSPEDSHPHSRLASDNIKYIAFSDTSPYSAGMRGYGGDSNYYIQQRWNQAEIDDETPIVGHILKDSFRRTGADTKARRELQEHLYDVFQLRHLLDKPLLCLSSGETRKFVLCRALMAQPRVLIMDNPFIGLDKATRQHVRDVMQTLSSEGRLQLILVVAKDQDIPRFITHVVPVRNMEVLPKLTREEYLHHPAPHHTDHHHTLDTQSICEEIKNLPSPSAAEEAKTEGRVVREVVKLRKVSIRYGDRVILKDLDWTVMNGERWSLSGPNGAGKSTLLSIICADNPQSYACDVTLFGRKRGTGESIWDIKRHIGYVSPEMQRAYRRDIPALRIVASGLKDSVGLHVKPTPDELAVCRKWLRYMGIEHLAERSFLKLSSGEQRMVLLARAFVKDPSLLILDEPLHGLDHERSQHVRAIIDTFCHCPNKTLIMVTHYEEELPPSITHHLKLSRH